MNDDSADDNSVETSASSSIATSASSKWIHWNAWVSFTLLSESGISTPAESVAFWPFVDWSGSPLLSWKFKLWEKRRINMWNNHSLYLQCWPSWGDSIRALLPSEIYGSKIHCIIPLMHRNYLAGNWYFVLLSVFFTQSVVGRPHLVCSARFIPEWVFYTSVCVLYPVHSPQSIVCSLQYAVCVLNILLTTSMRCWVTLSM